MNKFIKQNLLTLTFSASILSLSAEAMANGMPAVECCDEIKTLDQRVKRLEDKAVEGTSKKLFIAGSINRAITWLNDGVQANTAHVDNDHWPSNITVGGEAAYNDDVTFGLNTEIRFSGNSTANNEVHNATTAANAERTVSIAVSDIYMDSKKFGRITAGHGSMSSYGTQFYADQSGAYNFSYPLRLLKLRPID